MPKTYEYNGEIFTYEDMLEAYGDDAGVQNAVKQFGIKEQGNIQEDVPVVPGKKKTVAAKGAVATGQKNGASKKATGSSAYPWSTKTTGKSLAQSIKENLKKEEKIEKDFLKVLETEF
jgi:hypothetical protein